MHDKNVILEQCYRCGHAVPSVSQNFELKIWNITQSGPNVNSITSDNERERWGRRLIWDFTKDKYYQSMSKGGEMWLQSEFSSLFLSPLREISASANPLADAALNCSAGTAQPVMDVTAMQPSEKWLKTTTNVKHPLWWYIVENFSFVATGKHPQNCWGVIKVEKYPWVSCCRTNALYD